MPNSSQSYLYAGAARVGANTTGGVFRRAPGSDQWQHTHADLPDIYALTVHPGDPAVVYAGAGQGLFRSSDHGATWQGTSLPKEAGEVWAVAVHPADHRVLLAGTSPTGVWRSEDAGATWRLLPAAARPERVRMEFKTRVMRFAIDPARPSDIYAALEVGGVMRSLDGGEHWEECCDGLVVLAERPNLKSMLQSDTDTEGMLDAHALCVSPATPGSVYLAVRMGLFHSADRGMAWRDMEVGRFSPLTYARDVVVAPYDSRLMYACLSPAARSHDGSLYRSRDLGETWSRVDRGVKAEATMMALALDPSDPQQVHATSRCGQVFSTQDGGASWVEQRLPGNVVDVHALACG